MGNGGFFMKGTLDNNHYVLNKVIYKKDPVEAVRGTHYYVPMLKENENPSKFKGWYTTPDCEDDELWAISEAEIAEKVKDLSGNITVYAKWPLAYDYDYTGEYEIFVAPKTGWYQFEAWGAQGGAGLYQNKLKNNEFGNGAYTSGCIELTKGDVIYVYVGGAGTDAILKQDSPGGWNGGGYGIWDQTDDESGGGGGGATDFRLILSDAPDGWSGFTSLASRIMVAGGGGGYHYSDIAGHGGTVDSPGNAKIKSNGTIVAYGGTQTYGYKFGVGEDASGKHGSTDGIGGGGGGYYGGFHGISSTSIFNDPQHPLGPINPISSSAAGGSSFISGFTGCDAIASTSAENSVVHTGQPVHYSGMQFVNTTMIAGNVSLTQPDGTTATGRKGNGYARITYLGATPSNSDGD